MLNKLIKNNIIEKFLNLMNIIKVKSGLNFNKNEKLNKKYYYLKDFYKKLNIKIIFNSIF